MKKIILLIGLILFSLIVYSTAFNSKIEFKELYLYAENILIPNEEKIPTKVFFEGNEIIFYANLNKASFYSIKLLEAESRNLIKQIPAPTGMQSKKQKIEETLGILETREYTLRAEIFENINSPKTIREINFTVLPAKIEINVPETNPLLILGLLMTIITIIHRN
jgi:hypothetical protein